MAVSVVDELGSDLFADIHAARAARMELAALGRICGTGNVPLQDNAFDLIVRIGHRYSGEKRLRIGMHGVIEDILLVSHLHKVSEVITPTLSEMC